MEQSQFQKEATPKLLLRSVSAQQADSKKWNLHNNMMEALLLSHMVG